MTDREAFQAFLGDGAGRDDYVTDSKGEYLCPGTQADWELWQASRAHAIEEVAPIVGRWRDVSYLKLHAGEMSAAEVRTVKAVLFAIGGRINALTNATGDKA